MGAVQSSLAARHPFARGEIIDLNVPGADADGHSVGQRLNTAWMRIRPAVRECSEAARSLVRPMVWRSCVIRVRCPARTDGPGGPWSIYYRRRFGRRRQHRAAPAPIVKSGGKSGLGERGAGDLEGPGTRGEAEGWEERCSVVAPSSGRSCAAVP